MIVLKFIIAILAIVASLFSSAYYKEEGNEKRNLLSIKLNITTIVLIIIFSVMVIFTKWNVYAIPKIVLLVGLCLRVKSSDEKFCNYIFCSIIIAYTIGGIFYYKNIEKCESPDIVITKTLLVNANDDLAVRGNFFYVAGESKYNYYKETEDGGYKLYSIPADLTTIYYIDNKEKPYLETITTTKYRINTNNIPATRCFEYSTESYKLYVPEGSIENVFKFDAE